MSIEASRLSRTALAGAFVFALAGLTPALAAAPASPSASEDHPKMEAALEALKTARADLHDAKHDFNGHRVKAVEATTNAIREIEAALAEDKN
ncbi:MAG: hypothetical protein IPK66_04315 [Rhodospirillales bacterium]|nr:hypothetical protein [Rhodospirillales bacterium]